MKARDRRTRPAIEIASKSPVYRATTIPFGRDTNSEMRSNPDCQRAFRSVQFFDRTGIASGSRGRPVLRGLRQSSS